MTDDANLILPRLWLGNKNASMDNEFLQNNNISVVFNCTKTLPFSPIISRKYRIPVDDNLEDIEIANMEKWAPEIVYKVISEYKMGRTILIHCHAGIQRSAAVMAMMLIVLFSQPSTDIMTYIRSKRPIAFSPSANFRKSIQGFELTWKKERSTVINH